jgi:hypothetical protein
VEGIFLKQVTSLNYLGTIITSDGRCNTEIRSRIGQAKSVFNQMKNFLCNKYVSLQTRKRVVQTNVKSIMCYGCEVWTINKRIQSQLEAAEMWFLKRMMKVPWTAKISNKIILSCPRLPFTALWGDLVFCPGSYVLHLWLSSCAAAGVMAFLSFLRPQNFDVFLFHEVDYFCFFVTLSADI